MARRSRPPHLAIHPLCACQHAIHARASMRAKSMHRKRRQQFQCNNPLKRQSSHCAEESLQFCTAKQRPCQNDAHENGTCETRLSSLECSANSRTRGGCDMQGGQLIDSSHAPVPCDLCCVQMSASAMPACKWASEVCMRCVWCKQHARSPLQGGLSSVESCRWMEPTQEGFR